MDRHRAVPKSFSLHDLTLMPLNPRGFFFQQHTKQARNFYAVPSLPTEMEREFSFLLAASVHNGRFHCHPLCSTTASSRHASLVRRQRSDDQAFLLPCLSCHSASRPLCMAQFLATSPHERCCFAPFPFASFRNPLCLSQSFTLLP